MHNAQDKRLYIYSYIYLIKIIFKSWEKCILLSYFAKDPIDGNHLHNQWRNTYIQMWHSHGLECHKLQ
jgi:hypothetical protein